MSNKTYIFSLLKAAIALISLFWSTVVLACVPFSATLTVSLPLQEGKRIGRQKQRRSLVLLKIFQLDLDIGIWSCY
ncbi:MAG: hypothetical protein V7K89_11075 [Nostoc sp.]|uniref:hypothetical protein n=1 Tax=Nostoc sp. TaxID=1180 RepID=UPI002FF9041F